MNFNNLAGKSSEEINQIYEKYMKDEYDKLTDEQKLKEKENDKKDKIKGIERDLENLFDKYTEYRSDNVISFFNITCNDSNNIYRRNELEKLNLFYSEFNDLMKEYLLLNPELK